MCERDQYFDTLFDLYQRGADAQSLAEMDDQQLNAMVRSVYGNVAKSLEVSDVAKKMAEQLGLDFTKPVDAEVNAYSPELSTDFLEIHPCPACKGVGWAALFMTRRDCEFCEGKCEVNGVLLREYEEANAKT